MKETPKCAGCSYMGWPVPRRITGNNRFTKPGGKTPVIKTSPRWCPLREGNGGHVRESFKGVSD